MEPLPARSKAGEELKVAVCEDRHNDASLNRLWRLRHNTAILAMLPPQLGRAPHETVQLSDMKCVILILS